MSAHTTSRSHWGETLCREVLLYLFFQTKLSVHLRYMRWNPRHSWLCIILYVSLNLFWMLWDSGFVSIECGKKYYICSGKITKYQKQTKKIIILSGMSSRTRGSTAKCIITFQFPSTLSTECEIRLKSDVYIHL